jgi:uracil-DNA glycosylase
LANELRLLPKGAVVVALGGIAHRAIIKAMGLRQADYKFGRTTSLVTRPCMNSAISRCSIPIIAAATTRIRVA